jgi:hypothetical protein
MKIHLTKEDALHLREEEEWTVEDPVEILVNWSIGESN